MKYVNNMYGIQYTHFCLRLPAFSDTIYIRFGHEQRTHRAEHFEMVHDQSQYDHKNEQEQITRDRYTLKLT